ncbi:hypothetical protein C5167_029211 [Papaver somniferum]|nr:hypothetical protein C5167_029211 [Papaver somniferum]
MSELRGLMVMLSCRGHSCLLV